MNEQFTPQSHLVVIGSSAGGIEALSNLVGTLPRDFQAPIVIAQHLHPDRISHLREILQRHCPLPVQTVTNRHELERGVVLVVPPNRHVEITDAEIRLIDLPGERPMPSIDHLFTSAAQAFGAGVIAVVLTGTGRDGAAGALEVKQAGGTVIIETPETSAFPDMPLALAPTTVDIIADLDDIGPILHDLAGHAIPEGGLISNTELEEVLDMLRNRSGVDFSSYKRGTILRRLQRRIVATRSANLEEYKLYLGREPDEYERLINSFLISVTEFFRDQDLFEHFLSGGLDPIIQRARERGELRIWSAGCATGEEAYSMAIVVSELLGDDLKHINVRIFGTDLSSNAIAFARRGVYPPAALKNLPPELVERYFVEYGGSYEVVQTIRSLVVFGRHDLGQRSPFPRIDLALCRNVLIYFTSDLQRRALQLFAFALQDRGLLVLGKTESVRPLSDYFEEEDGKFKIFRRVGAHVLIPPAQVRALTPQLTNEPLTSHPQVTQFEVSSHRHEHERNRRTAPMRRQFDAIIEHLPYGIVVVDQNYTVQIMNAAARQHLGIRRSGIEQDLIHLIQQIPLNAVRDAIDAAFEGVESTLTHQVVDATAEGGAPRDIEISFSSINDAVLVQTTDMSEVLTLRRVGEELEERLRNLAEVFHRLEFANEDLTKSNAVLRANNDELQISNEEYQAAAEEVETLNEELQATNEELETLNEELQATIEELNATNDDLEARSRSLEEMALVSERQRQESENVRGQLEAILASLSGADAIVIVDEHGEFTMANRAFIDTFGMSGELLQPKAEDGSLLPEEETPQQRAARGEAFTLRFYLDTQEGDRRMLEATSQPVGLDEQRASVVVVRDVTKH